MRVLVGVLLGASVLAAGCGPDCQSTCQRIYSTVEGGCGIQVPGRTRDESIRSCVTSCEDALVRPGQLGDYDPNTRSSNGETVTLENEKQAAAWMDCIQEADCLALDDGFCAPL